MALNSLYDMLKCSGIVPGKQRKKTEQTEKMSILICAAKLEYFMLVKDYKVNKTLTNLVQKTKTQQNYCLSLTLTTPN